MQKNKIEIKPVKRANKKLLSEMIDLYKDAGWWHDYDPSYLPSMIKNSFCVVGAFSDGRLVGMGRSISDGHSDAYLQDIVVLKTFRKLGIGSMIVSYIKEQLIKNDIDWIGSVAAPGSEEFYKKLGFKRMKDFVPMRLEL